MVNRKRADNVDEKSVYSPEFCIVARNGRGGEWKPIVERLIKKQRSKDLCKEHLNKNKNLRDRIRYRIVQHGRKNRVVFSSYPPHNINRMKWTDESKSESQKLLADRLAKQIEGSMLDS